MCASVEESFLIKDYKNNFQTSEFEAEIRTANPYFVFLLLISKILLHFVFVFFFLQIDSNL